MKTRDKTRLMLLNLYVKYGLKALDKKAMELIVECENNRQITPSVRGIIKGELAEVVVECHIAELIKTIPNIACVKGLCIRSSWGSTTEIDLLMCTPCRVYLFECKSFSGRKTISDKCFLKGGSSSKDVFGQSAAHLKVLDEHIRPYMQNIGNKGCSPYKFLLFEFSSDDCCDCREEKYKEMIPLLTLKNIDAWLAEELSKTQKVNWDYTKVYETLKRLNISSAETFEQHLKRMGVKK